MKVIQTTMVPHKAVAASEVRDTEQSRLDDIILWARENLKGTLWWRKTQFRDPHTGYTIVNIRKKHFSDGYWVYTFWFSKKSDAALFFMFWGMVISGV